MTAAECIPRSTLDGAANLRPGLEVVLIGGGTGTANIARDMVEAMPEAEFVVAVGTADSGGSTGRVRQLFDVPAPGDGRRVISRLGRNQAGGLLEYKFGHADGSTQAGELVDDLYDIVAGYGDDVAGQQQRTLQRIKQSMIPTVIERDKQRGGLYGHALGNLVLAQMMLEGDDIGVAFQRLSGWSDIDSRVRVMPSSADRHQLYLLDDGGLHTGEAAIDELEIARPEAAEVWVRRCDADGGGPARIYPPLADALARADIPVLAPSSLFTTHAAHGAVQGFAAGLRRNAQAGGSFVAVANLTQERDSRGLGLPAYVDLLGRLTGRDIDVVLANDELAAIPAGKRPIAYDPAFHGQMDAELMPVPMARPAGEAQANDALAHLRSDVATDGLAIAAALRRIASPSQPGAARPAGQRVPGA